MKVIVTGIRVNESNYYGNTCEQFYHIHQKVIITGILVNIFFGRIVRNFMAFY